MNELLLQVGDALFGWLLRLPADLALTVVAVGSSLILSVVRIWTTDQDRLARCAADKRRLAALQREAKQRGDREALLRHRAMLGRIGLVQMRQEGRPLVAAIVPLALLATWAFGRLEFHAPAAGQPIEVRARFPAAAAGRLAHIVPCDGVEAEGGWIREVALLKDGAGACGEASWRLRAAARTQPYMLQFRYGRGVYEQAVRVGQRTCLPPVAQHDDQLLSTEVALEPVRLFGVVPGIPALGLAPWMVAYLILMVAAFPVVKRGLRLR